MDYRLEELSDDDFESLVNVLCQKILGIGVVSFTKGPDGGRDGRFIGTASSYPSTSKPWEGKFIIQAKHTSDYDASCSDNDFGVNKSCLINKEIEKIKALVTSKEIDNYLLFTNRKETESREDAVKHIKNETGLVNVDIIGKNTINTYLSQNKDVVKQFNLNKFTLPFEFFEQDIRNVIVTFYNAMPKISGLQPLEMDRPSIEKKNLLNNLSPSYFEGTLIDDLNRYRDKILLFLQEPKNDTYAQYYEETTIELKRIVEVHIEEFDDFKKVFAYLTNYIIDIEPDKLKKYKNIIPAFFHFMYYQCDIGRSE